MAVKELPQEVKDRILENLEGRLSREDSIKLRDQIHKEFGYEYGVYLKEVSCPNEKCKKPLMFTFAYVAACLWRPKESEKETIGCGKAPKLNLIYGQEAACVESYYYFASSFEHHPN